MSVINQNNDLILLDKKRGSINRKEKRREQKRRKQEAKEKKVPSLIPIAIAINEIKEIEERKEEEYSSDPKREREKENLIETLKQETNYYIKEGLRYVYPYYYCFSCSAKARWYNQTILEIYTREFIAYPSSYYENAIKLGRITVNHKKVEPNYLVKNGDVLRHLVHRHELPIAASSLVITSVSPTLYLISKPSSWLVHPSNRYRHNTLHYILLREHGLFLYTINRLDRQTGGLMIMTKSKKEAAILSKQLKERNIKKYYIGKVKGKFSSQPLLIKEPLICLSHQHSFYTTKTITPSLSNSTFNQLSSKEATSSFCFLSYDEGSDTSLVHASPHTGRTHQLRVHLASIGHPIANDAKYGGKEKESKKSEAEKERIEAISDHSFSSPSLAKNESFTSRFLARSNRPLIESKESREERIRNESFDPDCPECKVPGIFLFNQPDEEEEEEEKEKTKKKSEIEISRLKEKGSNLGPEFLAVKNASLAAVGVEMIWLFCYAYATTEWRYTVVLPNWSSELSSEQLNEAEKTQDEIFRKDLQYSMR